MPNGEGKLSQSVNGVAIKDGDETDLKKKNISQAKTWYMAYNDFRIASNPAGAS